jgi:hypothetical protein
MKKREHIFVTLVEGVWDKMKNLVKKNGWKLIGRPLYVFKYKDDGGTQDFNDDACIYIFQVVWWTNVRKVNIWNACLFF